MGTKTKEIKVVDHVISPNGKQIVIPKVTMNFGNMLTSVELPAYGKLVTASGGLPSPRQVVVAVHENSWLKVGDHVQLDFSMFPYEMKPGKHDTKPTREVMIPEEHIDKRSYIYCTDRHVKYRVDDN